MPSSSLAFARSPSVRFELPPPLEGDAVIPPPSLGQLAAAMRLDPRKGVDRKARQERITRLRQEAEVLLGPERALLAGTLTRLATDILLDPQGEEDVESQRERIVRLQRQAEILFGPEHAHLINKLLASQVTEFVQALYLAAAGIDPTDFLAVQAHLRKQREEQRDAAELAADIDKLIIDLAADLGITPEEAAKIPVADAVSLRAKRAEKAKAADKFEAALHGVPL